MWTFLLQGFTRFFVIESCMSGNEQEEIKKKFTMHCADLSRRTYCTAPKGGEASLLQPARVWAVRHRISFCPTDWDMENKEFYIRAGIGRFVCGNIPELR
jgi:hypothetical protein